MKIKLAHVAFLLAAIVGFLYVWHMYTQHNTRQIIPSLFGNK